jgi:hypothetical protein
MKGLVPEQLATNKYIENFPSSSGRENLQEHSVTCCKVDKNSGRDASDEIRWPKIAMQQVSLNFSVIRLHDSFAMPLLLLCGLWVSKSLFPKVAHAPSRLSLEPMHRGQETVLGM